MKKVVMTSVLAALVSGYGYAGTYQFEGGISLGAIDGERDEGSKFGLYGEYHFSEVDNSKGPLAEAAFLDRSSFVTVNFDSLDLDEAESTVDRAAISARLVSNGFIVELGLADTEGDLTEYSLGLGFYASDTTDVVFTYERADEASLDKFGVNVHSVYDTAALDLSFISGDQDFYSGKADATYYPNNAFGVGIGFGLESEASVGDSVIYSVFGTYFISENLELGLRYDYADVTTDITFGTETLVSNESEVVASAAFRF